MASKKTTTPKLKVAKIHESPQPKDGWDSLGKAYEGRKRPEGLGRDWQ